MCGTSTRTSKKVSAKWRFSPFLFLASSARCFSPHFPPNTQHRDDRIPRFSLLSEPGTNLHGVLGGDISLITLKNDAKFLRVYGKNEEYTAKPASRAAALVPLFFGYLLHPLYNLMRLQSDLLQAPSKAGPP